MKAIVNAVIVKPDHYINNGVILIDNGIIADCGTADEINLPAGTAIIDAGGRYAGPGLIDIHCHGGDDVKFFNDCVRSCNFHLAGGTTFILPTLYCSLSAKQVLKAYRHFKENAGNGAGRIMGGIYMEGPYLNQRYGSGNNSALWSTVNKAEYAPLVEEMGDFVKVWALSPEREGIEDFVKYVKEKTPGALFAVAHSEAAPEDIERLIPYGLCIGTHHTNATGDRPVYPECRGVCVDETVNYRSEISAEVISDRMGIHVAPYMQRLIKKIKGIDKILLITDNSVDFGPIPDEEKYRGAYDIYFDSEGEINGSRMRLSDAAGNFMKHTGSSMCEVFKMASYNQAKLLSLHDRGEIKKGNRADIVIADEFMKVYKVLLGGTDAGEIINN